MKKTLFTILVLFASLTMQAQVTIGSAIAPNKGALLDLKDGTTGNGQTAKKGLAMPRVALQAQNSLKMGATAPTLTGEELAHTGLLVYNISKNEDSAATRFCPGLHVWDGAKWQPLSPYPAVQIQKTLISDVSSDFTHLDPDSPAGWPADKNRAQYLLGYIGKYTDARDDEVYPYTRFYVGLHNRTLTYEVRYSYSCDPTTPNYGAAITEIDTLSVFEDGIWMAENLRAKSYDLIRDGMDSVPTLTMVGPRDNANNATNTAYWAYPNTYLESDTYEANKSHGLLYTWHAATRGKGGEAGDAIINDGDVKDGPPTQGICPTGWHLPSDREWTDLENGIIRRTSIFSTTPNIDPDTNTPMYYYSGGTIAMRGTHGTAMKSTTALAATAAEGVGTSKSATDGGFNWLLTATGPYNYGDMGVFWSASGYGADAFVRQANGGTDNSQDREAVLKAPISRNSLLAVRCKKNL